MTTVWRASVPGFGGGESGSRATWVRYFPRKPKADAWVREMAAKGWVDLNDPDGPRVEKKTMDELLKAKADAVARGSERQHHRG